MADLMGWGGPAFPLTVSKTFDKSTGAVTERDVYVGMTLRDWFAGQALAGLAAADGDEHRTPEESAALAFRYADAMLVEREKGGA